VGRMNWEARGGTTFLAIDPPSWINTVGMYQNWRVIERQGVKNIFNVGPRLLLFDGMDGIAPYINPAVYLIANDGRLLKRSSDGVISLIEPNLVQGGSAKWFIIKSDRQVTISDPDKVKNLFFGGTDVSAVKSAFSWKVWQASPGSDLFFISCLDSAKKNWIALEVDTENDTDKVLINKLDIDNDNQVWRLLLE